MVGSLASTPKAGVSRANATPRQFASWYAGSMVRRSLVLIGLALVGSALVPSGVHAANGLRPRTPAIFSSVPCVQTLARGEVLHIEYSVPYDDTELTPDELPDSRRQQLFAFSQQRFDFAFPVWITQADFDRAQANGDVTREFGPDDVLESSSPWPAGSWLRITPDDPRLPITAAQAAMGVDWDTTDVAPGTWLVAAYTWEPENNLWSPRFGAVRVEDPDDPDATGPTVFLPREDGLLANRGEPLVVSGCVQAPPGSTITAYWGTLEGIDEPQWVPFIEDQPVEPGDLSLEFVAPAEAGDTVKLRVEVTDPAGRTYVAHTPTPLAVIGEAPEETGDEGDEGCACSTGRPPPHGVLVGLVMLLLLERRRRRA
jgi:MYXO-CTERM domain-containing protein